jgi:predicted nucleotide-binding protein (sugar kinase/HSP70/actin superfamily)
MTSVKTPKFVRENQWAGHENPLWRRRDKKKVTILYNLFESRKSLFMRAYFEKAGYKFRDLGRHKTEDVHYGREWGSRMMCNPTYFTSGSFIRALLEIEKNEGLTKEQIVDRFIFLGGGGDCTPCRYGMYPEEYMRVADDAGFKGFRVLVLNTELLQYQPAPKDAAFRFSTIFLFQFCIAFILADFIHIGECAVLPYAKNREDARKTIDECENIIYKAFRNPFFIFTLPVALFRAGKKLATIPREKKNLPLIFITGEVFANHANGDANYNLRRFIIDEGAEVLPAVFSHRARYECWRKRAQFFPNSKFSKTKKERKFWKKYCNVLKMQSDTVLFIFNLFDLFFNQKQFSGKGDLPDLDMLSALAEPYYSEHIIGGEGNMEIGEAIYYHDKIDGFI